MEQKNKKNCAKPTHLEQEYPSMLQEPTVAASFCAAPLEAEKSLVWIRRCKEPQIRVTLKPNLEVLVDIEKPWLKSFNKHDQYILSLFWVEALF